MAVYDIKVRSIISRNPQANSILERVHQTKDNIIHTFKVKDMVLNNRNPWDRILAPTIFEVHAIVHTINAAHTIAISAWTGFNIEHISQRK